MSKCIHNQQIKYFCIKSECHLSNPAGCSVCLRTQHSHAGQGEFLQLEQLLKLMGRYSFSNKIKPECVNLQQSFYSYFKKIQNQLKQMILTIDEICKNVVNTIGFPYICFKNNFTVYKRIKNKQYSKLVTSDFQKFVNDTKNTPLAKLAESQEKLYIKQVNNAHQMIKEMDYLLGSFQNLTKYYDQKIKFTHDNSEYMANKVIVQKIKNNLKINGTNNQNKSKEIQNNSGNALLEKNKRLFTEPQQFKNKMVSSDIQSPSIKEESKNQIRNSLGKNQGLISGLKSQLNGRSPNLMKTQEKETPSKRTFGLNLNLEKKFSGRRASIDTHLVKNKQKLEEKASKIRQSLNTEQEDAESQQTSKERIKNNDLPAQEQKIKNQKQVGDEQILPVTRKLQQKLYQNQLQEVQSPLLKNKFKAKIRKLSQDNGKQIPNGPQICTTQSKPIKQQFQIKPEKIKKSVTLPQLTEEEERSFLFLTASFKLETSKAIPMLEKALEESSKNLSAVQYLSYLYLESNEFQKCLRLCDKYLYIVGNNKSLIESKTLLLNNKASALNNLGRYSQSVKLLQKYLPENESLLKNLGNAYYGLGYLEQAIKVYQKILTECHDDQIYYNLSGCLYLIKQFDAAKVAIDSALAFQPMRKQYLELQDHIKNSIKNAH